MIQIQSKFFEKLTTPLKTIPTPLLQLSVLAPDQSPRTLFVYNTYILATFPLTATRSQEKSAPQRLIFTPDLIFSLVREPKNLNSSQCSTIVTDYKGFSFQRHGKKLTYYNNNNSKLEKSVIKTDQKGGVNWNATLIKLQGILAEKLKQRNFQEFYKPIKKIGKGNFASVYLATRMQDGKKFAVKVFSKSALQQEDKGFESVENEIKLMRKLKHGSLMRLEEVFQSDSSLYLVVELLEGGQLSHKINKLNKLTLPQIQTIFRSLLEGLAELERLDIIHRDLKPENILFRSRDSLECVIADFGLATLASQPKYLFTRCGTPGYVSPEIINSSEQSKVRFRPVSDMFSLGVIFCELHIGEKLFDGDNVQQILSHNRRLDVKWTKIQKYMSKGAFDLMMRMVERDPSKRIKAKQALKHAFWNQGKQSAQIQKIGTRETEDCEGMEPEENDLVEKILKTQSVMPKISFRHEEVDQGEASPSASYYESGVNSRINSLELAQAWKLRETVYVGTDTISEMSGESRMSFDRSPRVSISSSAHRGQSQSIRQGYGDMLYSTGPQRRPSLFKQKSSKEQNSR